MAKLFDTFVACGSVLLLAVTLVAAGFAAVAVPDWATVALSRAFSGCDQPHTPFTANELTAMAVAGKHYTFDSNNAEELSSAVAAANASAEADGRANKMGEHSEARSLPTDAISHLDDVYRVVSVAKPLLFVVAIICIAGLAHVAVRINRRALGRVLTAGGAAVLVVFAMSAYSTACSSKPAPGRLATTACLSPCTLPRFGWAWPPSGLSSRAQLASSAYLQDECCPNRPVPRNAKQLANKQAHFGW